MFTQDFITRKSGEVMECKITNVDSTHIYFDIVRDGRKINTLISLDDVETYQYGGRHPMPTPAIDSGPDQITLLDGTIVKGKIIEQVPNRQLTIRTSQGELHTYQLSEIEKISRVEFDLSDYGSTTSLGFALFGGGIAGMPFRYYPNPETAIELGVFMRPFILLSNEIDYHSTGLFFNAGINFFGDRKNNSYKRRVYQDGVSFKFGYGFQLAEDIQESMITLNWIRERFNYESKKSSFIFELGGGILHTSPYYIEKTVTDRYGTTKYTFESNDFTFIINLRLLWSMYY